MMKDNVLTRFLKNLFRLSPPPAGPSPCPTEDELALFAAGETRSGALPERLQDHVARCPDCLEQVLTLRRLTGQSGPLRVRRPALAWLGQPSWRPLAAAAALVAVAGLLYLGGVSFQKFSEVGQPELTGRIAKSDLGLSEPVEPSTADAPAAAEKTPPAGTGSPVAKTRSPEPPAPVSGAPAEVRSAGGAGPTGRFAPETTESDDKSLAAPPAAPQLVPSASLRTAPPEPPKAELEASSQDQDELAVREDSRLEFAPAPAAPPSGSQVAGEGKKAQPTPHSAPAPALAKEESGKGGRRSKTNETGAVQEKDQAAREDLAPLLASICSGREPAAEKIRWQGRTFWEIRGYLVQTDLCLAEPLPPIRRAGRSAVEAIRQWPGYRPEWRGIWLIQNGEAFLFQ